MPAREKCECLVPHNTYVPHNSSLNNSAIPTDTGKPKLIQHHTYFLARISHSSHISTFSTQALV